MVINEFIMNALIMNHKAKSDFGLNLIEQGSQSIILKLNQKILILRAERKLD